MRLRVAPALEEDFPGLRADFVRFKGVSVRRRDGELENFKAQLSQRLRGIWDLESLKDEGRVRAYRDFFWRVGIDPTKVRPAAEALLRRILHGKPLPTINTFVDAYNLVSAETRVALAAFDRATIGENLLMRRARGTEAFHGIGMTRPTRLRGQEIVVEDDRGLIAVYPYRDADRTKVTTDSEAVVLLICGVPGIGAGALMEATERSRAIIGRFCGGTASLIG